MNITNYFKALGDHTRLRLVYLLLNFELNVNEIVSVLDMIQPRISRHLKVLLDSGLVTFRRDGLWVFYSAVKNGEGRDFIDSIRQFLEDDEVLRADILRCKAVIRDRTKETAKFFDSIAGDWKKLKENIIGDLDINGLISRYMVKCEMAVDIGCGNGDMIPLLLRYAESVIGVDRSKNMLEQAKKRVQTDSNNVSLRLGEAEHLPVSDNTADFALANMVLHHLSDPFDTIREVYRILKTNGSFIILDLLKHDNEVMRTEHGDRWLGFNEDVLIKWLTGSKFTIKEQAVFGIKNNLMLIFLLCEKQ